VLRVCVSLPLSVPMPTRSRFGAVLEEFEVRDALESVFYTKPELTGQFNLV
jgi:hypothetical protein